jgi:hypothetical protein
MSLESFSGFAWRATTMLNVTLMTGSLRLTGTGWQHQHTALQLVLLTMIRSGSAQVLMPACTDVPPRYVERPLAGTPLYTDYYGRYEEQSGNYYGRSWTYIPQ